MKTKRLIEKAREIAKPFRINQGKDFRLKHINPGETLGLKGEELKLMRGTEQLLGHGRIPWGKFAASKQVWLLCTQYCCLSFGWYFYITWLPTFLDEKLKLSLNQGGF
jgi:hypothetical protein